MNKYFQVLKNTFQEYFVYRLNFLLWRFRSFVVFLTLLFFWQAVYGQREEFLGYSRAGMFTYVIGITFLRQVILASRSIDLGGTVRTGELNNLLLRPINVVGFWFSKDLVDKVLNVFLASLEIALVIYLLKIPFYLPAQLTTYLYFVTISFLAMLLYFYLNFIFGALAFWTDQIWAPRWLMMTVLLELLSGGFFPLDVLPPIFVKIIQLTPFPYLVYFPMKIWLEQVALTEVIKILGITGFWTLATYLILNRIWKRGIRNYVAYGG
jgi:ABC-2 type transport system permease protein